jgi:hypothetical protein
MEWFDFDELDFSDDGFALHSGVWFPPFRCGSRTEVYRFIDKLSPEREPVKTQGAPRVVEPASAARPFRGGSVPKR